MKQFNPEQETYSDYLRHKCKMVGHHAFATWMRKKGFPFNYAYFIVFGKEPTK